MNAPAPRSPMLPDPMRVLAARVESPDIVTLTLDAGRSRASFQPGQFNMLYAFGIGEIPVSMSGDPRSDDVFVHTIKSVGAVSRALAEATRGDVVGVRGPYGKPWPMTESIGADLVIVAGGLGLAPLRPVVYHVLARRKDYGRVCLLVGARAPDDVLFRRELSAWQDQHDIDVRVTADHAPVGWRGRVGVVTTLVSEIDISQRTTAFVCGPEIMMRFTVRELGRRGVRDENIYLSMERNMKCAVGFCGHCQLGPTFVCKDGPVLRYDRLRSQLRIPEL